MTALNVFNSIRDINSFRKEINRLLKCGTHLTFNAIRVLKKNILTFCLHNLLTRALFSMDEKNLSIVFCGTQEGLRTTTLRKSM